MMNSSSVERPHQVRAVFEEAVLSFALARGATLADLAEQVGILSQTHHTVPLLVEVQVPIEHPQKVMNIPLKRFS
jgi:hypothetical protein